MIKPIAWGVAITALCSACGPMLKGKAIKTKTTVLQAPPSPQHQNVQPPFYPKTTDQEGVLVVNVPAAPSKVSLVVSSRATALEVRGKAVSGSATKVVDQETKLLCSRTPCAVKLPLGSHSIVIEGAEPGWASSRDTYDVDVTPRAQELTHTLSRRKSRSKTPSVVGGILLETLGWTLASIALPIAIASPEAGIGCGVGGLLFIYLGYKAYTPGVTDTTLRPSATTIAPHQRATPPQ